MGRTVSRGAGWFHHRGLMLVETVLVLGLVEELVQGWPLATPTVPPLARVAAGMALSLTLLGGVTLLVQRRIRTGLQVAHGATRALPVRIPRALAHLVVFAAIFGAYAWLWDDETGALSAIRGLVGR